MLVRRRQEIEGYKELFGEEFDDYGLVFCSSNGHPIEGQVINRMFSKLIRDNGFPKVVFHSIRHTSITYKLKINGGDMKSVQGDSGHAQVKMVADVYSHIIDDDRQRNAQRFEEAFYSKPEEQDAAPAEKEEKKAETDMEVLMRLLQKPETAQLLKQLAAGLS
jgi:integrase